MAPGYLKGDLLDFLTCPARTCFRSISYATRDQTLDMPSAALGIQEDKVCVISERSIVGLDSEEADEIVKRVAHYADQLDDKLAAEFGARLVTKT